MKRIMICTAAIFFAVCVQAQQQPKQPENETAKFPATDAFTNSKLSYTIIDAPGKTYCYDVYADGRLVIHQGSAPGLPGNHGFATKADAENTKNLEALRESVLKETAPVTVIYNGDILHKSGLEVNALNADSAFIRLLLAVVKDAHEAAVYFIPGDLDWNNSGTVTADDVNVIARELWCPLCSGVRLDACELKACEQMKDMIAIKLEQGENLDSIRAYFLDQYGPQILGEPPRQGFSWLAWILPIAAMVGGAFLIWLRMKQMVRPATQGATISAQPGIGVSEEEAAKLREELKRYG